MTWLQFNRAALPVFGAVILIAVVVVPTLRLRRRTGLWPLSRQQTVDPFQRYVGTMLGLSIIGYAVWTWIYVVRDPGELSILTLPVAVTWVGWIVAIAGLALIGIAQAHMGISWRIGIEPTATPLVHRGVYRFIRHPIYTGWAIILMGVVLITPSPWTVMGWLWAVTLLGMQARLEDRHLLAMHGEQYRAFAARVGRFVPGIGTLKG
ncbi:MAG: isoprenylcysteine carboxylmethyltransferase family protein [Phycisphaerales bacterium]|nr:isoprenylcysteine carboxylmethyltransferase family protein [Phycisphaerales bacterium]